MQDIRLIDNPFITMEERLDALKKYFTGDQGFTTTEKTVFKVDLHLHSNYSDGYWTPTGLVFEAYRKGMELIALTDHDGFAGIEEAFRAVEIINECTDHRITFVPGIEFSTNFYHGEDNQKKKEIHILGYFPSKSLSEFEGYLNRIDYRTKAYMSAFQHNRILRIYEMVSKFNNELPSLVTGLSKLDDIQSPIISDKTVHRGMRNSIAPGRLLTSTGIYDLHYLNSTGRLDEVEDESFSKEYLDALSEVCENFNLNSSQDFMKEFFGKKEPSAKTGYIGLTESPKWAVKTILEMGGIPVLAHPAKYLNLTKALLSLLVPVGLKGVEVVSDHFKAEKLAQETFDFVKGEYSDLVITMGSDCHGKSIDDDINYTPNNIIGLSNDFSLDLSDELVRIKKMFSCEV